MEKENKNFKTVFDYGITEEEKKAILFPSLKKEKYLEIAEEQSAALDLAFLFHKRGDKKMRDFYANKLSVNMRMNFYRTIYHP